MRALLVLILFSSCASVLSDGGSPSNIYKILPKYSTSQPILSVKNLSKQITDQDLADTRSIWTPQTRQIINYHNQGTRTLILMRGLAGSGKSYLAKVLAKYMCPEINFKTFIFSTDDFFITRGHYKFNKSRLQEAHIWNQNRVREAVSLGLSPIFVDNTNVNVWETEMYVKNGVENGYVIEVLEPNTSWSRNAEQLAQKNSHNVTLNLIQRKLNSFQTGINGEYLISHFRLKYPTDKIPPIIRQIPPFSVF